MIPRSTDVRSALKSKQRGFLLNPFRFGSGGGGGTDPNFSSVSLLLHGDGTHGSTTITDSSSSPKTVTRNVATISTASPKFGTGAIAFALAGSGEYIQVPSQAFGTGDFTLEFWMRHRSVLAGHLVDNRVVPPTANLTIRTYPADKISVLSADTVKASSNTLSSGVYYHIALSRISGTSRFFVDGMLVGSAFADTANYDHTTLRFGNNSAGNDIFDGMLDDIRVTPGVGRYSANFTPPVAPFPDA